MKTPQSVNQIAVLIPCYNEALSIQKVITDFKKELPQAKIYVFDNNSTDQTAQIARANGASVIHVPQQGKGAVVRAMFRQIEADFYIIVDGDDTYPASSVHELLNPVILGSCDISVGNRHGRGDYKRENTRPFHNLGNWVVTQSINLLFRCKLKDILSGYRVMNKAFVKNCPILLNGFEVETMLTLHAVDKLYRIQEIDISYKERPPGSFSKLDTFKDGARVLRAIVWIFKDSKPLLFFSALSVSLFPVFITAFLKVIYDQQSFESHQKLLMVAISLASFFLSTVLFTCGLILDSLVRFHREKHEIKLLHFLQENKKNVDI